MIPLKDRLEISGYLITLTTQELLILTKIMETLKRYLIIRSLDLNLMINLHRQANLQSQSTEIHPVRGAPSTNLMNKKLLHLK